MTDPLGGLNPHHAVAGFGGALASLPFMKPATLLVAAGMLVAGLATSMYLTPIAAEMLLKTGVIDAVLTPRAELGLAFLLGLTSMISIPATIDAALWVKSNIARLMERLTGVGKEGPLMSFLDLLHLLAVSASTICVGAHMNKMKFSSAPKLELCAWWMLGVGFFGEAFWQVYWLVRDVPYYIEPQHVFVSLGMLAITILYTHPDWRPYLADRRKQRRRKADAPATRMRGEA